MLFASSKIVLRSPGIGLQKRLCLLRQVKARVHVDLICEGKPLYGRNQVCMGGRWLWDHSWFPEDGKD